MRKLKLVYLVLLLFSDFVAQAHRDPTSSPSPKAEVMRRAIKMYRAALAPTQCANPDSLVLSSISWNELMTAPYGFTLKHTLKGGDNLPAESAAA